MTPETPPAAQRWDPGLYDGKHAFVWERAGGLLELLAPQPGERILDLGCGTGHLTAKLAEAGAAVVGLDSSAEMLAKARSEHPHLELVQADACNFAFPEPFDAVFSNAVLHWILDPRAVVRCVHNCLRPGGRFVAEFGGRGNVQEIVVALASAATRVGIVLDGPRWYFPSVGEYAGLLESEGMEVSFAALFDRPTPLEGEDGLAGWVRMFARTILDCVPAGQHEEFLRAAEEAARPRLHREGQWSADYRRLQVRAVRLG